MADKTLGEQSYEHFARRYADAIRTKPHNAWYDRPNTLSLLPDVSGQRLLDAGCGPGFYVEDLLERGAEVVAFDIIDEFVNITRERVGDRATILRADLTQPLDFAEDASFDGILCPLVLDYIEDWEAVFREFYRVLKPGGWLVTSSGHPLFDWLYLQRVLPDETVSYFETQRFTVEWGGFGEPKPRVTSFRRSLQETINPLLRAGLKLDLVFEGLPTAEFELADPEHYVRLMREPGFVWLRAYR